MVLVEPVETKFEENPDDLVAKEAEELPYTDVIYDGDPPFITRMLVWSASVTAMCAIILIYY